MPPVSRQSGSGSVGVGGCWWVLVGFGVLWVCGCVGVLVVDVDVDVTLCWWCV